MSEKTTSIGVRYFDIVALVIGGVVVSGLLLARTGWSVTAAAGVVAFGALWLGVPALRQRAYAQNVPWLVGGGTAFLASALFVALWPAPVMWFTVTMALGSLLLLIGLVAPARPIGGPPTRLEIFKLAAVLVTLVVTIALAEGLLRAFPGLFSEETRQYLTSTPANSGVAHPYIGHLQTPHRTMTFAGKDFKAFHHVDAFGFRNRWPWPDRADIVALGDSLTYGFGVEDAGAWPAIVSDRTQTAVINLGLVGASPMQYLRVYETFGVKLQPKLLLVGVYAHNDFWDAGMFHQWLTAGVGDNYMAWRNFGRPLRFTFSLRHPIATAEGVFRSRVYPIVRSSHLYNLLRAIRGGTGGELAATKTLTFADGSRVRLDPKDFRFLTAGAQPDAPEFRLVVDALRKIRSLAASQGAHALMVLLPGKEEVYLPLAGEDVPDPARPLREALEEGGIAYLDLAPVFRERAAAGERLFFEVDSHPNDAGYALIGQAVASQIDRNAAAYGLVKSDSPGVRRPISRE